MNDDVLWGVGKPNRRRHVNTGGRCLETGRNRRGIGLDGGALGNTSIPGGDRGVLPASLNIRPGHLKVDVSADALIRLIEIPGGATNQNRVRPIRVWEKMCGAGGDGRDPGAGEGIIIRRKRVGDAARDQGFPGETGNGSRCELGISNLRERGTRQLHQDGRESSHAIAKARATAGDAIPTNLPLWLRSCPRMRIPLNSASLNPAILTFD